MASRTRKKPNPIRAARTEARLSQSQLAKRVGTTKATVSGWEGGRYQPTPENAVNLTRALPGLTLEAIYGQAA